MRRHVCAEILQREGISRRARLAGIIRHRADERVELLARVAGFYPFRQVAFVRTSFPRLPQFQDPDARGDTAQTRGDLVCVLQSRAGVEVEVRYDDNVCAAKRLVILLAPSAAAAALVARRV